MSGLLFLFVQGDGNPENPDSNKGQNEALSPYWENVINKQFYVLLQTVMLCKNCDKVC